MPGDERGVTPGTDRIVAFQINGGAFAWRRPSRADVADVARAVAVRVSTAAGQVNQTLSMLDGDAIFWEERLRIGLVPRRDRLGRPANLGERAPAHWYGATEPGGAPEISFDQVDPDEFDLVVEYLTDELAKKKTSTAAATSTDTVPAATSG